MSQLLRPRQSAVESFCVPGEMGAKGGACGERDRGQSDLQINTNTKRGLNSKISAGTVRSQQVAEQMEGRLRKGLLAHMSPPWKCQGTYMAVGSEAGP